MVQLVEALRYKPEEGGFDFRWHHRNFSSTFSVRKQHDPEVSLALNRNEYQKYFLGRGGGRCSVRRADSLTTFMCRLSWNLRVSAFMNRLGLSRSVLGLIYLYLYITRTCNFYRQYIFIEMSVLGASNCIQDEREECPNVSAHSYQAMPSHILQKNRLNSEKS
jgi:hypothetical protein